MISRSEIDTVKRGNQYWLRRTWYPRPRSDMEAVESLLITLSEDELGFRHGRFRSCRREPQVHTVQVWLDHRDEEKRAYDLREMLASIWQAECPWSFEFNATERLGIMFSFDDTVTAFMFMTYFGGSTQ